MSSVTYGTKQTDDTADGESEMEYDAPEANSANDDVAEPYVPRTFATLINTLCFKLHQFTTIDLVLQGLRFVAILLFASIVLPYNLFHILLFILIIVLCLIYIVGKNAFKADRVTARVDRNRLSEFRARFGGALRDRRAKPVARARTVHSTAAQ